MKKFIINFCFFGIPFLIWLLIVLIIDPYNYFSKPLNFVDNQIKLDVSLKINRPLFQLLEFKNHPTKYILLGDSRANSLDTNIIKESSNKKISNLAYGGGSLQEIINTFWIVTKEADLKEVYIGLNFTLYNKLYTRDRVSEAEIIRKNFISYAFCNYTSESTLRILGNTIFGIVPKIGIPPSSKESFWAYQLNVSASGSYKEYQYPTNFYEELKNISRYCNAKGIKLVFFIPPTHHDLQRKVQEFNLQDYEVKFKEDLKKMGDLYDFDYPCELTKNKDNFNDPFHFNKTIGKIIVKELFTNETKYYSKYSKCITYIKSQK